MEHLRQVWHASRERLPFRTPGSVPILGLANAPIVETKFLELAVSLLDFSPRIPLGTFSILLLILILAALYKATEMGWFLTINVKSFAPCRYLDGHIKEPCVSPIALG